MMRVNNPGLNNVDTIVAQSDGSEDLEVFYNHLEETFVKYGNRICSEIGLPIVFSIDKLRGGAGILLDNAFVSRFLREMNETGRCDGMLHRPQLRTALETILKIFLNPEQSKNIIGAMQCGKSTTQDALEFAGPILYAMTGAPYFTLYLGTQSSGNTVQAKESRAIFNGLYSLVGITFLDSDGEPLRSSTIAEYRDSTPNEVQLLQKFALEGSISSYRRLVTEPARRTFAPEGWQTDELMEVATRLFKTGEAAVTDIVQHQRSNRKVSIDFVSLLLTSVSAKNYRVIVVADEIHWGADEGGVMDRFLKSMYEHFASNSSQHIVVGVSATPFATSGIGGFENIFHAIGEGYCGPTFYRGEYLPTEYPRIVPEVVSFNDTHPLFDLALSAYDTITGFTKWADKHNFHGSHDDYRGYFENEILGIISEVMFNDGGHPETPIAVCMRAFNNNDKTLEFVNRILPDDNEEGIAVDHYNSTKRKSPTSMKRWIAQNPKFRNQSRFFMTVTGGARMADAFPTTHIINGKVLPLRWRYIELSATTMQLAALLQGLYGRCCGYGKIIHGEPPIVMMSQKNFDRMAEYHHTLGKNGGSLLKNVKAIGSRRGREQVNFDFNFEAASHRSPIIRHAYESLQCRVASLVTSTNPYNLQGNRNNVAPIWDIITPDVLKEMERLIPIMHPHVMGKVDFLRPATDFARDADGEPMAPHYHEYDPITGNTSVGFRRVRTVTERTGGNDTQLRATRRTKASEYGRQPQVHVTPFEMVGDQVKSWEVREITFFLNHGITFASMADDIAVGDGSAFQGFRSVDDMLLAYRHGKLKLENLEALISSGKCTRENADLFLERHTAYHPADYREEIGA